MTQSTIGIGASANDGTGDPIRTAFTKSNNNFSELFSVWSQTVNAGAVQFTGTTEQKITLAIANAVSLGLTRVFLPDTFVPYNPALVTFNSTVMLIREGGNPEAYDAKAYGAYGDGLTDDTAAIQAAIEAANPTHSKVHIPAGTYKTLTSLTLYVGTHLEGETLSAYSEGFGLLPSATTLSFVPTVANSDCFVISSAHGSGGGFRFHISLENLFVRGNGATNSRYGLNLNSVIYSTFINLTFENFKTGVLCTSTIFNKFDNVFISGASPSGSVSCVDYAGQNETTDVWKHCTFTYHPDGSSQPSGVRFLGTTFGVEFHGCIWETLDNYGMEIAKDCVNIQVFGGYCENVPLANNAAGAMFKVGFSGTTLVVQNQLTVMGGTWQGRNAGTVGSMLDCDFTNGVQLHGVSVARYTNVIQTTANTRLNSIIIEGLTGISWTNLATDFTKVMGVYPSAVIGVVGQTHDARLGNVGALRVDLSAATGGQVSFPVTQNPSADPNTLDDYAQGTFTPNIGGTATYTTQLGRFVKIGNMVYVQGRLVINVLGTGSTSTISGLPYAASANPTAILSIGYFTGLAVATITLYGLVNASASTFILSGITASGTAMTIGPASLGAASEIRFSGWYEAGA